MQLLANENFPLDAVEALRHEGHDVIWIRTDSPGSKDRDILHRAVTENRVLLTFDKDFGDLAFQFGLPALRQRTTASTNAMSVVGNSAGSVGEVAIVGLSQMPPFIADSLSRSCSGVILVSPHQSVPSGNCNPSRS